MIDVSLNIISLNPKTTKVDYLSYSQVNIRAAPVEEEKEVGNAEGGDGVESLRVGEESGAASEDAQSAGAE